VCPLTGEESGDRGRFGICLGAGVRGVRSELKTSIRPHSEEEKVVAGIPLQAYLTCTAQESPRDALLKPETLLTNRIRTQC